MNVLIFLMTNYNGSEKFTMKYDQEYTPRYRKPYQKLTDNQKKLNKIKRTLAVLISNPWCEVCGEDEMKRLTKHHHAYFPNSIVYKNYETQTDAGALEYYENLEWEVRLRPWIFSVLCNSHHKDVHELLDMPIEKAEDVIKKRRQWISDDIELYPKFADRHRKHIANYDRLVCKFYRSIELRRYQKQGVWATV